MAVANNLIASVCKGKTFADVGGLYGVVNERVSVAYGTGASEVTMVDNCPLDDMLWTSFRERMKNLGVEDYTCIEHDISLPLPVKYDVVNCGGVIYHHPNPMSILAGLKHITNEWLIFSSIVTQYQIQNQYGIYEIPPSGIIFVPALLKNERLILSEYWAPILRGNRLIGITEESDFKLHDYAPCWFIPTAKSLESMCTVAGFEVVDKQSDWNGNVMAMLLKVKHDNQS